MGNRADAEGPYIVWLYFGAYEGWGPRSYATLKEALLAERYSSDIVITKVVDIDVREKTDGQPG